MITVDLPGECTMAEAYERVQDARYMFPTQQQDLRILSGSVVSGVSMYTKEGNKVEGLTVRLSPGDRIAGVLVVDEHE